MAPQTRYARSAGASIAYQVTGDGPIDLLFLPGLLSHVEFLWEEPGNARFLERLASVARVILMDRRGAGLSDRIAPTAGMDDEVVDVEAVLDAAGSERASILAYTNGGPLAVKFAVERPDRVRSLVLYACFARPVSDGEYDWAHDPGEREAVFADVLEHWGEGLVVSRAAPSVAGEARMQEWFARFERFALTPGTFVETTRTLGRVDVRGLLPRIAAPTLVLHRTGDRLIDVRHSRYLAEHIPGARLVELPGIDSMPSVGDPEPLLAEIAEFLTGERAPRSHERALRTVLFTDICDGTARAAQLGDRAWRDLLAAHDAAVRRQLERFGGVEVKTIGDGFLASFAGPPSDALRCASAIVAAAREIGVTVRAGAHTGECELIGDDLGGMAVHIAARVSALAGHGEVLASSTVREAVAGSGLAFAERGEHDLKGVPERWTVYALAP